MIISELYKSQLKSVFKNVSKMEIDWHLLKVSTAKVTKGTAKYRPITISILSKIGDHLNENNINDVSSS